MTRDFNRRTVFKGIGTAALFGVTSATTGTLEDDSQPITNPTSGCVTITTSGNYQLDGDIDCLEITADKVHLDGNGYVVGGFTTITGSKVTITNLNMGSDVEIRGASHVTIQDSEIDTNLSTLGPNADRNRMLLLEDSHRCHVLNTPINGNSSFSGVRLRNSDNNRFESCRLISPGVLGLLNSNGNTFIDCEMLSDNPLVGLIDSDKNLFKQNFLDSKSGGDGFRLFRSNNNRFVENELDVTIAGFFLRESARNLVLRNVVETGLEARGVILEDADENRILHNDFCQLTKPTPPGPLVVVSPDSTGNVIQNVDCDGAGDDDTDGDGQNGNGDGDKDGDEDNHSDTPEKPPAGDDDYCKIPE